MALQSEWTNVTPAMAVDYLSRGAPNRSRRKLVVEKFARDMGARGDGDTWYLISDADLIAVQDETFGTGLDTWDF
jgi:hypothetical protein